MNRRAQIILLCEDSQQEAFVRRYLKREEWDNHKIRVRLCPSGRGSGEQAVRLRYPEEVVGYRSNRSRVDCALIVMIDGDACGLEGRLAELKAECQKKGIAPRADDEQIAIFVPTWNIETWFSYLGGADVDEGRADYPRLARERDCGEHVKALHDMCRQGTPYRPLPPSLAAACAEFNFRIKCINR